VAVQIGALAAELPQYRQNIAEKARYVRSMGKGGVLENVQETVKDLQSELEGDEKIQAGKPSMSANSAAPTTPSSFDFSSMARTAGMATLVLGLVIFMLAQREELRNRLIRVIGYAHQQLLVDADRHQRLFRAGRRNGAFSDRTAVRLSLGVLVSAIAVYPRSWFLGRCGFADASRSRGVSGMVVAFGDSRDVFRSQDGHQHDFGAVVVRAQCRGLSSSIAHDDRFLDLALGRYRAASRHANDGLPGRLREARAAIGIGSCALERRAGHGTADSLLSEAIGDGYR
jgi:hypothetical protein